MIKILKAFLFAFCCLLIGGIGSISTTPQIPTWYATLNKPFFQPPNYLFGPVWTLLYIMMGISAFMIWDKKISKKVKNSALTAFAVQLFLNAAWSPIFFSLHWLFIAFIVIVALWSAIVLTIKKFYPISKSAAYLLIPYLLWVSFASVLNLSLWLLNR
jgi:translocator protein